MLELPVPEVPVPLLGEVTPFVLPGEVVFPLLNPPELVLFPDRLLIPLLGLAPGKVLLKLLFVVLGTVLFKPLLFVVPGTVMIPVLLVVPGTVLIPLLFVVPGTVLVRPLVKPLLVVPGVTVEGIPFPVGEVALGGLTGGVTTPGAMGVKPGEESIPAGVLVPGVTVPGRVWAVPDVPVEGVLTPLPLTPGKLG